MLIRAKIVRLVVTALALVLGTPSLPAQLRIPDAFVPDPATVRREGAGFCYPQDGWIVLHIEGEPYERGFQHGALLASEIVDYARTLSRQRSAKDPEQAWRDLRTLCDALFLRGYDREWLAEMQGIADGATAKGARLHGRPLELKDVVALNSEVEAALLEDALRATPTGLEGTVFHRADAAPRIGPAHDRCSAFAATGPATKDGKVVIGHITMWNLTCARHFNVWIDIKPAKGHRVLMQSYAGSIWSGMDYYRNDAGIVLVETTISQTRFGERGTPLAGRCRQAMQYGDSIDAVVRVLGDGNNGLYTNEWLLADIKTDEIAMFELGTYKTKLWRSSKNEWFGGTEGFYWGCNNEKDTETRLESIAGVEGRPADVVFKPSDRDMAWLRLFKARRGSIDAGFGFEAFTTAPLAASHSIDAKFTTTALAGELKSVGVFGPPIPRSWEPTPHERQSDTHMRPLVPNDWTLLGPAVDIGARSETRPTPVIADASPALGDQADDEPEKVDVPTTGSSPAWHGTLLPAADADIWLAAATSLTEAHVALECCVARNEKNQAAVADAALRITTDAFAPAVSRFLPLARAHAATMRLGRDLALADIRSEIERDEWHDIAAGKGFLLLLALRDAMGGDAVFVPFMDAFGRAHAGKRVTTAEFRAAAEQAATRSLGGFFDGWLSSTAPDGPALWSIDAFLREPQHALIVYGTLRDAHAQREGAELLARGIATAWCNIDIRIVADVAVTQAELAAHHVLLVGRPGTNRVATQMTGAMPVGCGTGSFVVGGKTYGHPRTAIVAAGANPQSARWSSVMIAGLSAEATRAVCERFARGDGLGCEVAVFPRGGRVLRLAPTLSGTGVATSAK